MVRTLTVPGALMAFRASKALTPAMHALVLRIANAIDAARFGGDVSNAVWFELPAAEVRGGRDDNQHLREMMRRLMAVELAGEYRGRPWGAVLVAEWRIEAGGSLLRVLVPPAAVNVLRAPETFAKVEEHCLVSLTGAARELYLALADRKGQRKSSWEPDLTKLRAILGVGDRKAYGRWDELRRWVLLPAVSRINDFGTVHVTMTPIRHGRSIGAVRFDWRWKSLDEARESAEEAERPRVARRKPVDAPRDALPLIEAPSDPRPSSAEERKAILARTGAEDFIRAGRVNPR